MQEFINYTILSIGDYTIKLSNLLEILLILVIGQVIIWVVKTIFRKQAKKNSIDKSKFYSIIQIVKYVIWTISIALILEAFGVKITILIASSAALFVGLGIGLQQIFNDLVSGLILLFEGSVRIDDVIEIDKNVFMVKKIGLRTSEVESRDDITMIVPNSLLVSDKLINWSHNNVLSRFKIKIGVAYGTDPDLVIYLLIQAAENNSDVSKDKKPLAHLVNFGDSSLDFELLFWSEKLFRIRSLESDIRREIIKLLNEHNVTIPFPQRDIHVIPKGVN